MTPSQFAPTSPLATLARMEKDVLRLAREFARLGKKAPLPSPTPMDVSTRGPETIETLPPRPLLSAQRSLARASVAESMAHSLPTPRIAAQACCPAGYAATSDVPRTGSQRLATMRQAVAIHVSIHMTSTLQAAMAAARDPNTIARVRARSRIGEIDDPEDFSFLDNPNISFEDQLFLLMQKVSKILHEEIRDQGRLMKDQTVSIRDQRAQLAQVRNEEKAKDKGGDETRITDAENKLDQLQDGRDQIVNRIKKLQDALSQIEQTFNNILNVQNDVAFNTIRSIKS